MKTQLCFVLMSINVLLLLPMVASRTQWHTYRYQFVASICSLQIDEYEQHCHTTKPQLDDFTAC